jgi:hypothetical protein
MERVNMNRSSLITLSISTGAPFLAGMLSTNARHASKPAAAPAMTTNPQTENQIASGVFQPTWQQQRLPPIAS